MDVDLISNDKPDDYNSFEDSANGKGPAAWFSWQVLLWIDHAISVSALDTAHMMPTRQQAGKSSVKYHKLRKQNDGYVDMQFEKPPPKVPVKAILLATILFVLGSLLIILGAMLLAGYIDSKYSDRTWPLLILGALMFIPGSYHVRIAYYAWKGYQGYSFEDIPDFDD